MPTPVVPPSHSADVVLPLQPRLPACSERVIVVGASTGGTEALKLLLLPLPAHTPPILIAQHMPELFTKSFAERLDAICKLQVKEAEHGERLRPGCAYVAPGHSHLLLALGPAGYTCVLSQAPAVNRHRPAVDVLFRSAANVGGGNVVGVILTGMGRDGAVGMREMHDAGAYTLAQDEATSVVYGMPKEAIAMGGVDEVLPLKDIAPRLLALCARRD
ncbi:chemotaxis protein CheB [Chitinolyticbacter albus]|uniref:chemotaxis protein CheB n=1 Tax=Chitinolyticbacter albus TaxID=2961951 RepID=UPI00210BACD4|nr:chemotaxis protein CheB [Chitinolyticbacter albus]